MEYCEYGSIENIMETVGATLSERHISIIMKGILQALDYLHNTTKVLHRDLKAANILLTDDADVKVCTLGVVSVSVVDNALFFTADFGVSRELDRQLTFSAFGTPQYVH